MSLLLPLGAKLTDAPIAGRIINGMRSGAKALPVLRPLTDQWFSDHKGDNLSLPALHLPMFKSMSGARAIASIEHSLVYLHLRLISATRMSKVKASRLVLSSGA